MDSIFTKIFKKDIYKTNNIQDREFALPKIWNILERLHACAKYGMFETHMAC